MTTRTPCTWNRLPPINGIGYICQICKGHILIDGEDVCPFYGKYNVYTNVQHLITADERFWCIQQIRKSEEPR